LRDRALRGGALTLGSADCRAPPVIVDVDEKGILHRVGGKRRSVSLSLDLATYTHHDLFQVLDRVFREDFAHLHWILHDVCQVVPVARIFRALAGRECHGQ
jgi:hypothetical protein